MNPKTTPKATRHFGTKRLQPGSQTIEIDKDGTIWLAATKWRKAKAGKCRNCGVVFYVPLFEAKRGRGIYCSKHCGAVYLNKQRSLKLK